MSEIKTANPRIPSPLDTAGILAEIFQISVRNRSEAANSLAGAETLFFRSQPQQENTSQHITAPCRTNTETACTERGERGIDRPMDGSMDICEIQLQRKSSESCVNNTAAINLWMFIYGCRQAQHSLVVSPLTHTLNLAINR